MEIAKALIVTQAAGSATADWPFAPAGGRHLFPIANQPIIHHHLRELRAAGLLEATIVADAMTGESMRLAIGDGRDFGLNVKYLEAAADRGLGATLGAAGGFIGDEPILIQGAGALLEPMQTHISAFARERLDALSLRLRRAPEPHAAGAGLLLSPRAVAMLAGRSHEANPVAGVEAMGGRVREQAVDGCCACDGDVDTLLDSNRRMLATLVDDSDPPTLEGCKVQGPVRIHPTARLVRTVIRGPAVIGPHARLTDSYVGPYTAVGASAELEGAEIEHSIVLHGAALRFVGVRIESSVIGAGARVVRDFRLPAAMRMCIGDGTDVVLP